MSPRRSNPKGERTRARRQALQLMYQSEMIGRPVADLLDDRLYSTIEIAEGSPEDDEQFVEDIPLDDYARTLALGTSERIDDIDAIISDTSDNWKLWRMPAVDRNILRLAVFEIMYNDDVPVAVAINEAVELGRAFGGDESPKFINGILGRIADTVATSADADAETAGAAAGGAAEGSVPEVADM